VVSGLQAQARGFETATRGYGNQQHTRELLMMGIVMPETC